MRTVFSTKCIHPRDRFDYWMDFVRRNIIVNDAKPVCRKDFEVELKTTSVCGIEISITKSSAISVTHTQRHAKQASADDLFIFMPVVGFKKLEQDGRQVCLTRGQFALIDLKHPHCGQFSDASEVITYRISRQKLESRVGNIDCLTARSVTPGTPEGSLASAYLEMLPLRASGLGEAAQALAEAHLLDLVALSLTKAADGTIPRTSSVRAVVRMTVRAEIEARLADPSLDADTIASAAGVSVKYANAILAEEDTSIRQLLQARRLARCRHALEDPAQLHRSVSEIAYGWGFSDMTHFGRRFKAAYGLLPSECRRRGTGEGGNSRP
ncbi:helix-turn-helix domain-containing protein [Methylobacterium sp. ID0610]|uniref:helix-turn-helix domain-containing protein n=1 Tax=Methylobacterium carpenticola TaxID=3344827 RepID=UPI0036BD849D